MWTTKDVCFLALRARLSTLEFSVRGTWMISELLKLAFKNFISSIYTSNAGHSSGSETIFTSWEQYAVNLTWNWWRFLIHSIAHINASIFAWRGDKDSLTFLAPIRPSNSQGYYTNPVLNKYHYLSMSHLWNTIAPKWIVNSSHRLTVLPVVCLVVVLQFIVWTLFLLFLAFHWDQCQYY